MKWLIVVLVVVLTGCTDDPVDIAPNDVGDTGLRDVQAPDGFSMADMGSDAGGDADLSTLAIEAANYCELTATMFCRYYLRCGRMAASDQADCEQTFLETCNAVYEPVYEAHEAAGLLALSGPGIDACAAHLSDVACEEQLQDLDGGCAQMWQGLAGEGEPCSYGISSFVCEQGTSCRLSGELCGSCEAVASVGQSCSDGLRCQTGAQCLDDECVARRLPGQSCAGEQRCVIGASCEAGVCVGYQIVAVGERCDGAKRCPYKASCAEGVCVEDALQGEGCADRGCASGYCDGQRCRARAAAGASCSDDVECASASCEAGSCAPLLSACLGAAI